MELLGLVRMHFIREKKLEILSGGGEQVLYRFPDGRQISNWDLIRTPEYDAFKRGFKDGFEGRKSALTHVNLGLSGEYESGFRCGGCERKKYEG